MVDKLYPKIKFNNIQLRYRQNKVGLYNLRSIEFRQKQTDNHKLLDKLEYVVVIGCHHIWIDDFMSFVKYYNLEDKFGIN